MRSAVQKDCIQIPVAQCVCRLRFALLVGLNNKTSSGSSGAAPSPSEVFKFLIADILHRQRFLESNVQTLSAMSRHIWHIFKNLFFSVDCLPKLYQMKVFISWSGTRSHEVAKILNTWIKCTIQAVQPWLSSKDIDRGSLWFTQISEQLAQTSIGIVCLTQENKNNAWILFESGALAKGLSSNRVCTLLIDLEPTDIKDPLAQFNHSKTDKIGMYQLLHTINLSLGENKLPDPILESVFETYWPDFESKLANVMGSTPEPPVEEKRDDNDIMKEILNTVRSLDKRLVGVESTQKLKDGRITVTPHTMKFYGGGLPVDIAEIEKRVKVYDSFIQKAKKNFTDMETDRTNSDDDEATPLVPA